MPTLLVDADDCLIHVGGDPDGQPREHVRDAVKLFAKAGWTIKVWSKAGSKHAADVARKVKLKVDPALCYTKPAHPYTPTRVKMATGSFPDLQLDDLESEAIPGVTFVHTPRTGDFAEEATTAALARAMKMRAKDFNEAEERDDHGRWTSGGSSEGPSPERGAELLTSLDNSFETAAEVGAAVKELGAEKIDFPGTGKDAVYVYQPADGSEPSVIEWDGKSSYSEVSNAYDWVGTQDVEDYYPTHEQEFNDNFWKSPETLYHGTDPSNVAGILQNGLETRSETRGFSNRYEGAAVYTSTERSEAEQYYGTVITIDTAAMARDGVTPFVNQEPDIVHADLKDALASQLGLDDFNAESEGGISPTTVVVNADIPPKYVSAGQKTHRLRVKYSEDQPRDDHGRFASGGASDTAASDTAAVDIVDSNAELQARLPGAVAAYQQILDEHGGQDIGLSAGDFRGLTPDEVTPEQRARLSGIVDKFMANPKMQEVMKEYGVPLFICTNNVPGVGDMRENGVVAAWKEGTVMLGGSTLGDPQYFLEKGLPLVEQAPRPGVFGTGDWGEGEGVMVHEYGHQVGITMDLTNPDSRNEFVQAATGSDDPFALPPDEMRQALGDSLLPISQYAATSGPEEAFSEAFAVVVSDKYNRDAYPPESQRVLDWVQQAVFKK